MGPIAPDDLRFNQFGLSLQESRVLALAMSGRIDKQIAAEMGISLGTVRVYWKRIRQKVGGTRSEAITTLARTSLKLSFDDEKGRADRFARELEQSLAREQALRPYETAFQTLPIPLAILDAPTGKVVHVNPAFSALHGYDCEELIDLPSSDLMASGEAGPLVKLAQKAESEGGCVRTRSVRRRKDGTTFEAQVALTGCGAVWTLSVDPSLS